MQDFDPYAVSHNGPSKGQLSVFTSVKVKSVK